MKKFSFLMLSLAVVTLFPRAGITAGPVDADGNASVVIVNQVGIESVQDMDFGTLISPGYNGTFTLSTSGTLSCASQWICTGTPAVGKFIVSANNASVNVTYQDGTLSDGAGHTLALAVTGDNTVTLTNGTGELKVGATLSTAWDTPAGTYSTANTGGQPYKVTVNY